MPTLRAFQCHYHSWWFIETECLTCLTKVCICLQSLRCYREVGGLGVGESGKNGGGGVGEKQSQTGPKWTQTLPERGNVCGSVCVWVWVSSVQQCQYCAAVHNRYGNMCKQWFSTTSRGKPDVFSAVALPGQVLVPPLPRRYPTAPLSFPLSSPSSLRPLPLSVLSLFCL